MPKQDRIKTKYPGVYYITKGKEKTFYIVYYLNGKKIEEKAGHQFEDDMTAAKAAGIRAERSKGKEPSNNARREKEKAAKLAEAGKMTLARLWGEYEANKVYSKAMNTDRGKFQNYLMPAFGNKEPHEITRLDVDRLRIKLSKDLKPQTVKHIMDLLKRVVNYRSIQAIIDNLNFKIETIKVDNQKTEDLNPEQLKRLLTAIDNSEDIEAANIMKLALCTGMRRGEMFKLKWNDIDFQRGFILSETQRAALVRKSH